MVALFTQHGTCAFSAIIAAMRPEDLDDDLTIETLAVHAGQEPDPQYGAVAPPIYQTSTYAQDGVGRPRGGYEYARTQNPTRERLERAVAALEGGRHGIAFASGSAATAAVTELVAAGEGIVASDDVYGGTYRYLERVAGPHGVRARWVDLADANGEVFRAALDDTTRMVWIETPSNPHLKVLDIEAIAERLDGHRGARGERPILVADNTFASPILQRPLAMGADVVFHSATKYLAGHSDVVNGILVTNRDDLAEHLRFLQNASGAVPGPFDCFLVLRGLRTLALRMERHSANARAVAEFLATRDDVAWVGYPGLDAGRHAHPAAALAARQMRSAGGMVSFIPAAGGAAGRTPEERAIAICEATRVFTLGESLGGVESLIEVPAAMTHASVASSALAVEPALVRVSVGIEAAADLIADLRRALDAA
jgi:cystathionine gamma-synthase